MQPTTYHERELVERATAELRAKLAASEEDCRQLREELKGAGKREEKLLKRIEKIKKDNDEAHQLADYYRNRLLRLQPSGVD